MTTTRRSNTPPQGNAPDRRTTPALDARVVRLPRVRSAQKRIESGYYDRQDVRDRLASAVLDIILRD